MSRLLIFCLLGWGLTVLSGAIQYICQLEMVVFEVPLMMVMYLATTDRTVGSGRASGRQHIFLGSIDWSGGIVGLFLGYVMDLLSGGPKGLHSLTIVLMFLLFRASGRFVYLTGKLSTVLMTFSASIVSSLLGVVWRLIAGVPPRLDILLVIFGQAVWSAIWAPLLIGLFRKVEEKLHRENAERGSLIS